MPTISDVAQRAGVSPATVSRVIQGASNVRPATRQRVEQAIEELGYVPSAVAQSLRSKRTRFVALVVPDITNTYWTTVVRGVEDIAQEHDYSVLLSNTDENPAKQRRYLDFLVGQQVAGIIIAPYDSDAQNLDVLRQRNIPTVLVDRRVKGWDVDSVLGDSIAGARALVQHLIGLGHRRIAIVSGPTLTSTAEDRVAGYCLALTEAGIPLDPRLIRRGEYRLAAGAELMEQLLDEGLNPTAIFAANNAIALGVIDVLEKRGLRIPQDLALVSFDDLPNASHIFPFLTVVAQPAYDMGVNAAQLLLSHLESDGSLRPRHVVLPSRLIIRHSCGSKLKSDRQSSLSLPIARQGMAESVMVKPLSDEERNNLSQCLAEGVVPVLNSSAWLPRASQSDVTRLLKVLSHQEADRVPFFELGVTHHAVYEYVLERELAHDPFVARISGLPVTPGEHVDFALRLGMDAVPCHLCWWPTGEDPENLGAPPSLAEQLGYLEWYFRAARGTNVGVVARFSSFFEPALLAAGMMETPHRFLEDRFRIERLMDAILARQQQVMRVVCDRFADDLALVMVSDPLAGPDGLVLPADLFVPVYQPRMERMIAPAREHGKLLLMSTNGGVDPVVPLLRDMGFDAVHPGGATMDDLCALKEQWRGEMALVGNLPAGLLAEGSQEEIEEAVRIHCARLAPGGGYALASTGGSGRQVPPKSVVTMTRSVHKYGRYGSLGQGAIR